jgi:hypothetical protein
VDEIIRDDRVLLLEAILSHDFDFDSWLQEMEKLDADWDLAGEEAEELEWRTRTAFDRVDRTELLAWFAAKKAPSDARVRAWLASVPGKCDRAERFIADRSDRFLCLASDLAAVIASSRPGLEETDPRLWETLGKHRRIEEAREEVELAPRRDAVLAGVARGTPEPVPMAVDPAYLLRDNQFWYSDCTFADLVREKACITVRIQGLGVRTLSHAARGRDGRITSSFVLANRADRDWWGKQRRSRLRVELLAVEAPASHQGEKPAYPLVYQAPAPIPAPNQLPGPASTLPTCKTPSHSVLVIGLDIAWFGGSARDPDSQYDCLGWVFLGPREERVARAALGLQRIALQERDPGATQVLRAIATLLEQHRSVEEIVIALDAPLQAVPRARLPARVGSPSAGSVVPRACERYLGRCRKLIDQKAGRAEGWYPNIQPGAPLSPRVAALLDGLKRLGFQLWTAVHKRATKLVIECFPAEAIWAVKRLNRYPEGVTARQVRAYKSQRRNRLTGEQVRDMSHAVLDAFGVDSGNPVVWKNLVNSAIDWMLSDLTWQMAAGSYRGGKLLDDVVDTMICLGACLSYVHGRAHVWQDPECPDDGHIIGPGQLAGLLP